MITVNAMGDTCPIPVVKTKKAIKELNGSGVVETLVDNEIAVQNLTKMAVQKGYEVKSEKSGDAQYKVTMTVSAGDSSEKNQEKNGAGTAAEEKHAENNAVCIPDQRRNTVVVISSDRMGEGNDELGKVLLKGFIFAISQQETLPQTILFYNGGAQMTCTDSPSLEDLKSLEAQGVEILTCGTCLNYYGLTEELKVGEVTNMYVIAEKMTNADKIIKP